MNVDPVKRAEDDFDVAVQRMSNLCFNAGQVKAIPEEWRLQFANAARDYDATLARRRNARLAAKHLPMKRR